MKMILIEAAVWSLLWMVMVSVAIRQFPWTIEHDYPEDVRKAANISKPSMKHKRNGTIFMAVSFLILFGLLIVFAVSGYEEKNVSFLEVLKHVWIVCMMWNVVDLIVVDWLLICLLSCRWMMLPGTEDCAGNKNYMFHFIGFLKGCIAMSVLAFIFAGISYILIRF